MSAFSSGGPVCSRHALTTERRCPILLMFCVIVSKADKNSIVESLGLDVCL